MGKWKWIKRILIALLVLIIAFVGYGYWQFNKPRKCQIEAPGPLGVRIDTNGIFANYYPVRAARPHSAVLVIGGS